MALGDDAIAAGMDIVDPEADRREGADEITKTRDYLAQRLGLKVDKPAGGAGVARAEPGSQHSIGFYTNVASTLFFRPEPSTAVYDRKVITEDLLPAPVDISGKVNKSGDTMSGNLDVPNLGVAGSIFNGGATAATSGFVVAYFNGDGRLSKGTSSRRFKKFISSLAPSALGNLFAAPFSRWRNRADGKVPDDPTWRYGYIAEDLVGTSMEPFVVYDTDDTGRLITDDDGNLIPLSIDFIGLLLAQVAQLNQRVTELEAEK